MAALFWHDSLNDREALEGIRAALQDSRLPHQLDAYEAHADSARAARLLEELRQARFDLVFALGTQAALLARELAETPVIYTAVTNPVVSGVVPSWGGSGTGLAGNSNWIPPETVLHVFQMAVPRLQRLGVLSSNASRLVSAAELRAMREHLAQPGAATVTIVEETAAAADEIPACVRRLLAARVQAIWVPIDFTIYTNMPAIRAVVAGTGVPLVTSSLQASRGGAVAAVLVDYEMLGRRAAEMALQVLRDGRSPGTIPVGVMRGYQVVVNPGAARRAGYEVPLALLAIADVLAEDDEERSDGRR